MNDPLVSIILRSFNEAWALGGTLDALSQQDYRNWELIVIDSGSTDGSQELIQRAKPAAFVQIQPHEYNPSRVMNHGMRLSKSEYGIFLNADATPQGSNWLRPLVNALRDPKVAAVFGRQIPRPDCEAVYACDYDRCFGPHRESAKWDHFFSMVSSGLRKDIWSQRGFLEQLQYAEDDEYTRWAKGQGYRVVYVEQSVVMHSHNYTPAQAYKRSFGDAKALAASWKGEPGEFNFLKTRVLGFASDLRHDIKFCMRQGRPLEIPHAARIRWEQRRGKLEGFKDGWNSYRKSQNENTNRNESLSATLPRGI
ncbi:MAG: glycosyltransferase family 2 protein [Verrucomicrobiales bacterium]